MSGTTLRTAIVTGGARGIGAAIARRLADDGAKVAVLDLDAEGAAKVAADISTAGGQALALTADVSDEESVRTAVATVVDKLGEPGILVNNAGIIRDNLLFKMSTADWNSVMDVHLRGAFLMSREAQSHMVSAGWGRIVNLSSTSALGNRGQANYAAAKAGLQGLTKTLALELGRYGITANAVAPGFIETEMTKATAERMGVGWDEFRQARAAEIPVRRSGVPADVANTVAFLAGEGSGFVSGQVIYVAGGPKC